MAALLVLGLEAHQAAPARMSSADETRLQDALAAFNAGQTRDAERVLEDLAPRYPDNFEVLETLGLIYAERGQVDRALPLLETACKVNASSGEAAANLGVAYLQLNRVQSAVTTLGHAASLDPGNSQTLSSYGRALMLANRPREAAGAFANASAHDPANVDTLYNWALAEFESGDALQASEILARIPSQSHSAQVESLSGDVEENLGHFDRALSCFRNAAKLEPSEPNLNALGLELLKHWSFEAAAKVYEYSLSLFPSSERLQTGAGIAFYGNAEYSKAAGLFSGLLVAAPDKPPYAKFLGQSCVSMKTESHELCDALLTYAQGHPNDAVAGRLAAATIISRHDADQFAIARQLLEAAIAKDPGSADGYFQMGVLYQEQGKWSDSLTMLKRAAALRPGSSKTHLRLALAYAHLEQEQQAHREAELQKHFRQSEDAEMEARRKELKTFILEMR